MLSVILDFVMCVFGPPRRAFGGLYHCAKFGWNRYSSCDTMQVLLFRDLGLKTPIHVPKIGALGGVDPLNGELSHDSHRDPQKALPCAETRHMTYRSSKSVKPRRRYGDFSIFQDSGRHLGFSKFQTFNGRTAQEGRSAPQCDIWSKSVKPQRRYGDFSIFQDGGRRHLGFCDACFRTTHEEHLVVFITVQNLVGIDTVVSIICKF